MRWFLERISVIDQAVKASPHEVRLPARLDGRRLRTSTRGQQDRRRSQIEKKSGAIRPDGGYSPYCTHVAREVIKRGSDLCGRHDT